MTKRFKSIFKTLKNLDFIFFGKEKIIEESFSTAFYPRKNYFFEKQMI